MDKHHYLPKPGKLKAELDEFRRYQDKTCRLWDMCSLFLQGKQHIRWDRNVRNFVGIPAGRQRNRVTVNMILNIFRNVQARLAIAYPSVTVMPASPSTEDIAKAQGAETFLRYYWHTEDMPDTIETLIRWLILTGNGALHTYFDPDLKEIKTEVISPYDLFFEPGSTSFDESRYVAVRSIVVRSELEAAYPEKAEIIKKSSASPDRDMRALFKKTSDTEGMQLKDRLEVFEVYTSDGGMGVLLGTTWLYKCDWPTRQHPVTTFQYTTVPGRLWGIGLVEPLIELQMMYNKGRTQIVENAELMGNPKWLIPKSSGVGKDALSDSRPGEKVVYNANAGPPPTQVDPSSLPHYVLDNIKQLSAEMLDVAGVHSTSLGKRAIGIESGAAIDSLSKRDGQQLQVTQSNIEKGIRIVAKCLLGMAKMYYTEEKFMGMLDETGRVVHTVLKSTNLSINPEVYIEAGTLFRDEKQDRDKKILDMVKIGLLDKDEALKELSYRTGNARITKRMAGFSHAHDMLRAVRMGNAIEIMPSDDLGAFSEVFSDYMRTREYYKLNDSTQDYIRDVLIAVSTFGKEEEEYQEKQLERTVFPRTPNMEDPEKSAIPMMATAGSPLTAAQMAANSQTMAQRRALVDDPNPEAGVSRVSMGGTG
jgi:hypothetical protein